MAGKNEEALKLVRHSPRQRMLNNLLVEASDRKVRNLFKNNLLCAFVTYKNRTHLVNNRVHTWNERYMRVETCVYEICWKGGREADG